MPHLFLPTAYVVRREGYVLTRVCLSVHTGGGGGTPARSRREGGTPARSSRGVPPARGYPTSGTPHLRYPPGSDLAGGYPDGGIPHLRYTPLPVRPDWGVPRQVEGTPPQVPPHQTWLGVPQWGRVPHLRYPPSDLGGTPMGLGTPPRVVLDTPRSVCLLRSRRRTFLSVISLSGHLTFHGQNIHLTATVVTCPINSYHSFFPFPFWKATTPFVYKNLAL